jgi:spoIIIJ-associated protein
MGPGLPRRDWIAEKVQAARSGTRPLALRFSLDRVRGVGEIADWPQEPAERVRELVEEVLDELDLDGEVEILEEDDRITASVEGEDDYGLLIGKRGQTIDALQLIAYQAAFRGMRDRKRVVVDAAGYRDRRKETLTARADRAAEQALSGNQSVEMDPMSAQERRVVHEHLKERSGVETFSEGDEPRRCVVVAPLVSE